MRPIGLTTIAILAWAATATATPDAAKYSADANRVFWFLVTTDTHIGGGYTGGDDSTRLTWLVTEAVKVINPVRVVVCGDLVDASGTLGIPMPWSSQFDTEWQAYQQIVEGNGMTPGFYVDLPGNHDAYGDKNYTYLKKYSVQGIATGELQHSFTYQAPFGSYHFLTANTAGNDGAVAPADNAGLDAGELAYLKQHLADQDGAALQFAFGHHSLGFDGMPGGGLAYGQLEFQMALAAHHVAAYFYGHTHQYAAQFHDGMLVVNLAALGKSDDNHLAVVVVDNDSIAMRPFKAVDWPYVLISAPADAGLGGGNPHAYPVPTGWTAAPVRVTVFSKEPPQAVEFQLDDRPWAPLSPVAASLWAGTMDTTGLAGGTHKLRARALPWADRTHEISFQVGGQPPVDPGPADEAAEAAAPDEAAPEAGVELPAELPIEPVPEAAIETTVEAPVEEPPEPTVETAGETAGEAIADDTGIVPDAESPRDEGVEQATADLETLADAAGADPATPGQPGSSGCGCRSAGGDRFDPQGAVPMGLLLLCAHAICRNRRERPKG